MEKRMMTVIALIVAFLLMLLLLLIDGLSGLISSPPRRELQAGMAGTAMPLVGAPSAILYVCGVVAARFKKLELARALMAFSSVLFAFFVGSLYAYAAALRDPFLLTLALGVFAVWILWVERRRGGGLNRRILLAGIAVGAWAMIRVIAG